jgi:hypothetical protein
MSLESVRSLFDAAGFAEVDARVAELEVSWPDVATVAGGVLGTPYASALQALTDDQRSRFEAALRQRFASGESDGVVRRQTAAVVVRAIA